MLMKKELIIAKLKEIIDEKGTECLSSDSAEEVYRQLCEAGVEKQQTAAVNHTLLMGLPQFCRQQKALDKETVSEKIQKNCYFRKSYADDLADIYISLYSKENQKAWKQKENTGLKSFLKKEHTIEWNGYEMWEIDNVYVDCSYHAVITIKSATESAYDKELEKMLKKNPFLDEKKIYEFFRNSMIHYLDSKFSSYCDANDYYPPVSEDFEAEEYAESWCAQHGFDLLDFEGGGETSDYQY